MKRNLLTIAGIFASIVVLMLLSDVITIGDKIGQIHPYCEYAFYCILAGLFVYFIVWPIIKLHRTPVVGTVTDPVKIEGMNTRITEWAKTVFMVTAVSPNSKVDAFSTLVLDFSMMKDIILSAGLRPTNMQMWKLYTRILMTSLLAYAVSDALENVGSIQPFEGVTDSLDVDVDTDAEVDGDVDVDADTDHFSVSSILSKFKIPGFIVGAALDGATNALLTLRIGFVTKAYLVEGMEEMQKPEVRKRAKLQAIKQAIKALPGVIAAGTVKAGKGAVSTISNMVKKQ